MAKNFDLTSNIKVGVTDIVDRPRGPRSRKEKLLEREANLEAKSIQYTPPVEESLPLKNYSHVIKDTPVHTGMNTVVVPPTPLRTPRSTDEDTRMHTGINYEIFSTQTPDKGRKSQKLSTRAMDPLDIRIYQHLETHVQSRNVTRIISLARIADSVNASLETVGRHVDKLWSMGVIKNKARMNIGVIRGNVYELDPSRYEDLLKEFKALCSFTQWKVNQIAQTSMKNSSENHVEPRVTSRHTGMHTGIDTAFSSSSNIYKNTTTETGIDFSEIDFSAFPGIDSTTLRQFTLKYPTADSLQDFIDRVAYAIKEKLGLPSAITNPNGFLFSSFKEGVNVGHGYKSRKVLRDEEELRVEQAEMDELLRIRNEKRRLDVERSKLCFEDWLETTAKSRMKDFEEERKKAFPSKGSFDAPMPIRMKQLKEIQVDTFLMETGTPMTFRDLLIG